jgi:Flp pilus assembly protein TadD
LALPPGILPAAQDPDGILSALADLEEVGQLESAVRGYEEFLVRWPESWRGAFGWGNALHALGQEGRAEQALRRAHGAAPERPEPLNNLALLALTRSRLHEADAAAQLAVDNAAKLGLGLAPYEDTLRQVRAALSH